MDRVVAEGVALAGAAAEAVAAAVEASKRQGKRALCARQIEQRSERRMCSGQRWAASNLDRDSARTVVYEICGGHRRAKLACGRSQDMLMLGDDMRQPPSACVWSSKRWIKSLYGPGRARGILSAKT